MRALLLAAAVLAPRAGAAPLVARAVALRAPAAPLAALAAKSARGPAGSGLRLPPRTLAEAAAFDRALFDGAKARPQDGFFGPDSMMWEVNRHNAVGLGMTRALLLQFAHPPTAESLAASRQLVESPTARYARTGRLIVEATFGDLETARAAVRIVNERHARVAGRLSETVGAYPAGTPYSGKDPESLFYVLATLYDSSLFFHDRFVGGLTEAQKDRYYAEYRFLGRLFGIPEAAMPFDRAGFAAYLRGMTAPGRLAVGAAGRALTDALVSRLFFHAVPLTETAWRHWMRYVAATLPEPVRRAHALPEPLGGWMSSPLIDLMMKAWATYFPGPLRESSWAYRRGLFP